MDPRGPATGRRRRTTPSVRVLEQALRTRRRTATAWGRAGPGRAKDELPVEVVVRAAPRVPVVPLLRLVGQHIDRCRSPL